MGRGRIVELVKQSRAEHESHETVATETISPQKPLKEEQQNGAMDNNNTRRIPKIMIFRVTISLSFSFINHHIPKTLTIGPVYLEREEEGEEQRGK